MNRDEMLRAAAYVFKSRGGTSMSARDLVMEMSMRRKWMTYSKAVLAVEAMREEGILRGDDDFLEPDFDYESVDVTATFRPDIDSEAAPPVAEAGKKAAGVTEEAGPEADMGVKQWGIAEDVIERSRERWKEDLRVGEYGALLLAGYQNGVDVSELIGIARKGDSLKR